MKFIKDLEGCGLFSLESLMPSNYMHVYRYLTGSVVAMDFNLSDVLGYESQCTNLQKLKHICSTTMLLYVSTIVCITNAMFLVNYR